MLSPLAQRALDAYGGAARWSAASAIEAVVSTGGLAFRSKWRGGFRRLHVHAAVHEPLVRMEPVDGHGNVGVLSELAVRIESAGGGIVTSRPNPRSEFPYGRRLFWWDRLDLAYFVGYALWNYLAFPALLVREDIDWRQVSAHTLEARFPSHLPTHCPEQRFHFDSAAGLLRQHDYTAEVFGGWAKAAHVIMAHESRDGIPFPSKRRVTPRRWDGRAWSVPVLIWIEVRNWRLI